MTDKTISIYWFFILFIVASAIVFLVYSLYGKPLDVRQMEGIFLAEKVADCVSQGGKIPSGILDDKGIFLITSDNLLQTCHLNFNTESVYEWNNDQFFVSIVFSTSDKKELHSISAGNENLNNKEYNFNDIDRIKKNKLPFCVERTIYSMGGGNSYLIKILTCVRKTEKNA